MPRTIFGVTVSDRRKRIIVNTVDRYYLEIEKDILDVFDKINAHEELLSVIIGEIDRIRYAITKRLLATNSVIT
jgi:hypothetical protein